MTKMPGKHTITKELADSIRQCLGRKVKLSLKVVVKAEIKSDKFENRVLGFSPCRLFVLSVKSPTRVDHHFHYLDIQAVESKAKNQLTLTVCDKNYTFYTYQEDTSSSHEVDTMILNLCTAIKNIFPSVPIKHIIRRMDIQPPSRLCALDELERATMGGTKDMGPCGGFSDQYACMCDYHALPYRAEVAWDVDTIYLSHDTRELYLHDFDYLEQKDLIPIISALEYNTWFRKFRASHSKLSHEAVERILHVISKSLSLEELYIDNIGAKLEFANKLSLALLNNSNIPLQKLDISHNPIEDKGAVHISNPIGRQAKGLAHLNLAYCGLTSKGVNMISHSLTVNKYMSQTLTYLSFAGNSLRDEVNNLYNFLAQPNVLKTLDLSATECAIDAVFGALLRGCTSHLSALNLSRNGFGHKKSKEMLPSFKQYFTSSLAIKNFNLSQCRLPADALKNVLLGLACNENISDVELDLSSNQLGATGAQIMESCIHGVRCLSSLDLSDNGLESQLGPVVFAISKNKSIKKLNIGRNLNNIKSKHVAQVMESVVHLIQEEDCVLESLIINDCRLKTDLHNLLNALGSNRCLQNLDISGNYMGDSGARLLAKALQINSKLQYISYDRNNVTLTGYSDILYAIQSNYSVKFMPFPVHDAMLCMKAAPERTESTMRKIQDILYRNVSPMKFSNVQAFRLQQGFIISSTQQQVERLVLQTGEMARTLKRTHSTPNSTPESPSSVPSILDWSDALISDAENSKQLISHLHDVVLRRDETESPIESKLHQISRELHTVIKSYLQDTVGSMVRSAQEKCPNVLCEEKIVDDIKSTCLEKAQVSRQVIDDAIIDQAGSTILNKVNEISLSVASTVSDRVIDEVVESLSKTCKSMQYGGEGPRKRASTGAELSVDRSSESSTRSDRSNDINPTDDTHSHKSDPSPLATPQLASKRKSLHGRKLRPQSVVDTALLSDMLSEDKRVLEDQRCSPLPLTHQKHLSNDPDGCDAAESLDSVSELPTSCGQLQHLGKARPRRTKTRAPTRPMGRADLVEEEHDISQGVDHFFRPGSATPTTPLVSPDSENSPRLLKFGSTSSMESFPQTAGARTASDRGSIDSLTESLVRSDSDNLKRRSRDTDEELQDSVISETSERNGEERKSISSLIGKLGGETALKLSPDLGVRKSVSLSDPPEGEIQPKRLSSGLQKYGRGISGNVLAEMKARQKLASSSKDEDVKSPPGGILSSVRLRSTGKSSANGQTRSSKDVESTDVSPSRPKPKLPPPLAPKPRPKSAYYPDTQESNDEPMNKKSVKELAASLVNKVVPGGMSTDEQGKIKSSSLPRSGPLSPDNSPCIPLSPHSTILSDQQMEALEETPIVSEVVDATSLRRQNSQKHVVSSELTIDDVVDV